MNRGPKSPGIRATEPNRKCVMVVEDEFLIRWMLSEELRGGGYHVVEACDAAEALSVLSTVSPDLIISDVRMPGPLDGLDLLARVRENSPMLPVIIISGHLLPARAMIEGATQFVAKPYLLETVVEAVATAIGGSIDQVT